MPAPVLDDQFWFDQSKKLTEQARDSRDLAAGKLQLFIGWVWTIFSGVTGFAISTTGRPFDKSQLVAVSVSSIALIMVYWLAMLAQMPKLIQFDARIPSDIQQAFEKDVKRRASLLNLALAACVISTIAVGFSFAYIAPSIRSPVIPAGISAALRTVAGSSVVTVSGTVDTATPITARIVLTGPSAQPKEKLFVIDTTNGRFNAALPLGSLIGITTGVQIDLTWSMADRTQIQATPKILRDS